MNGHTKCPGCLSTVRVVKGLIAWHKGPERFQKDKDGEHKHVRLTCSAHKQPALWAESNALNAMGRNTKGFCMKCWKHITDNNPICTQCNSKARHAQD